MSFTHAKKKGPASNAKAPLAHKVINTPAGQFCSVCAQHGVELHVHPVCDGGSAIALKRKKAHDAMVMDRAIKHTRF
jgi:hypothetical protein